MSTASSAPCVLGRRQRLRSSGSTRPGGRANLPRSGPDRGRSTIPFRPFRGRLPLSFERLFHPEGIAIIGASADLARIGGHPIKALKNAGYKGGIFPINPKYPELHGLKCYPDVMALKERCDLAVVAVPAPGVAKAIRDCGKAGIPFAVVLTAGFRETGPEGRKLEAELKTAVDRERRAHHRPQLPGHCCRSRRACSPPSAASPTRPTSARLGIVRLPVRRLRLRHRQSGRGAGRGLSLLRLLGQRDGHRHARAALGLPRRSRHRRWPSPIWKARPMRGPSSTSDASRSRRASRC